MNNIRNFCIISHIDHGKSTLADRFLELTGTVPKSKMREQYLDRMELERERGITIKMAPVRMLWHPQILNSKLETLNKFKTQNKKTQNSLEFRASDLEFASSERYVLNLIDTPGHVDFGYEVSRALAAVEGAILLVDSTKGIQAQTLANFELAKKQGLVIIPAVNKIDLPNARMDDVVLEVAQLTGVNPEKVLPVSAKNGTNVEPLLRAVVEKIPPPEDNAELPLRALVFDSMYDSFKGIVVYGRIVDGIIRAGDKILLLAAKAEGIAKEVGYFAPEFMPQKELRAGEIGYIATGIKEPDKVRIGDTIIKSQIQNPKSKILIEPLVGYQEPKPVVFASLYPENSDQYDELKTALGQLKLQDPAFIFEAESRESLGRGFRCGFLGTLHMEIISERIQREFKIPLVVSSPSVMYKIIDRFGKEAIISSASDWPDAGLIKEVQEPWVKIEVLAPNGQLGKVTELLGNLPGSFQYTKYIAEKAIVVYEMPLRLMIEDFYGKLKGTTQGYASMSYELVGWRPGDLIKLEVLIAGRKEEAFSQIIPRSEAFQRGRALVRRLKDLLPQQQFAVVLQAQVGGKIIASETIRAARKDVTGYLYGGDYTRKRKLLERQKKGKKELKQKGKVRIPPSVFLEMVKTRP